MMHLMSGLRTTVRRLRYLVIDMGRLVEAVEEACRGCANQRPCPIIVQLAREIELLWGRVQRLHVVLEQKL